MKNTNIVDVIISLNQKIIKNNNNKQEYIKFAGIIDAISTGVINDYGMMHYLHILNQVKTRTGHTPPLSISILKQLHKCGCKINLKK